jgi:hypothetical protein
MIGTVATSIVRVEEAVTVLVKVGESGNKTIARQNLAANNPVV